MGSYRELTDGELAALLTQKDNAALNELYNRYWGALFHHARRMLKDTEAAEDLVQDLFTYLAEHADHLNISSPVDAYLYRAVRNRVLKIFDKSSNQQKYISRMQAVASAGVFTTDEQLQEREMKRRIAEVVASFPPKMREAFEMSRELEMSRKEIATATGTSEETVKTQLSRAMKILRTKLSIWLCL